MSQLTYLPEFCVTLYRVRLVVANLRWDAFDSDHSTNSAWTDENLAEWVVQVGKMMEHPYQSQPNPGL